MRPTDIFDAIVIGAGSAGCVTASRLSAAGMRTLLVEAGPRRLSLWQKLPLGVGKALHDPRRVWLDQCESSEILNGRSLQWHAGCGSGGSSSVNGMLAVRGDPALYNDLQHYGINGWSYTECLPYFKALERVQFSAAQLRGHHGPIDIRRLDKTKYCEAFHGAFNALGIESRDDYNTSYAAGVYQLQLTAGQYVRSDASQYLTKISDQRYLTILHDTVADHLLVKNDEIIGVELITKGVNREVRRAPNVFLCLGAVRTPQILEKSGIGNPHYIQAGGISVTHRLDAVGENLRDHLMVRQTFEGKFKETINDLFTSKLFLATQGARYLLGRSPCLLNTSSLLATAFVPDSTTSSHPRFRVQLGLGSAEGRLSIDLKSGIDAYSGFHIGVYDISPKSVGSVHIKREDGDLTPRITPSYLTDSSDISRLKRGYKFISLLAEQKSLRETYSRRTRPLENIGNSTSLMEYFSRSAHTCWHPVGTCRMGKDESDSVTASDGRVHGMRNLFIYDASIYPFHTSSNTNLPVLMAAEKLVHKFLGLTNKDFQN